MYILYCYLIETYPTYLPTYSLFVSYMYIVIVCFYRSLDQLVSLIDSLSGSIHVDKEVKEEAAEEQEVEQEEADRHPEGEETGDQE